MPDWRVGFLIPGLEGERLVGERAHTALGMDAIGAPTPDGTLVTVMENAATRERAVEQARRRVGSGANVRPQDLRLAGTARLSARTLVVPGQRVDVAFKAMGNVVKMMIHCRDSHTNIIGASRTIGARYEHLLVQPTGSGAEREYALAALPNLTERADNCPVLDEQDTVGTAMTDGNVVHIVLRDWERTVCGLDATDLQPTDDPNIRSCTECANLVSIARSH